MKNKRYRAIVGRDVDTVIIQVPVVGVLETAACTGIPENGKMQGQPGTRCWLGAQSEVYVQRLGPRYNATWYFWGSFPSSVTALHRGHFGYNTQLSQQITLTPDSIATTIMQSENIIALSMGIPALLLAICGICVGLRNWTGHCGQSEKVATWCSRLHTLESTF